jgi:hypothetical protein
MQRRSSRFVAAAFVFSLALVAFVATRAAPLRTSLNSPCQFTGSTAKRSANDVLPFKGVSTLRPCACALDTDIELVSFVVHYFGGACGGTFVDIGANDGVTISNSHALEESLGWQGVCVEPHPGAFAKLVKNRPRCARVNAA